MDDLFKELEAKLSKVGSRTIWKRQIGAHLVWLSPITLQGQEKVGEVLNSSDVSGSNMIYETKRITLAYSIVGIDELDLGPFRNGDSLIPTVAKDGRILHVTLEKYLYDKLLYWGAQYLDDIFSVYADLLSTHQKENLQNIVFQDTKTPGDELEELERKVAQMRQDMGKPPLVEKAADPVAPSFDPFKTVG